MASAGNADTSSAQKDLLLSKLIRRQPAGARTVVAKRADSSRACLSLTQHKLWLIHKVDPSTTSYNESFVFEFVDDLHVSDLEAALTALVGRHETLRTSFREVDGEPCQVVAEAFTPTVTLTDLRHVPTGNQNRMVRRLVGEQEGRPFDLSELPLFRASVLRLGSSRFVIALTIHHLVIDTWSVPILLRELVECYLAARAGRHPALAPLPIQYGDFAEWQRGWFAAGENERQLAYWRNEMAGELPVLKLETDHPRPPEPTQRGARIGFKLGDDVMERLGAVTSQHKATTFMALLAGIYAWLHRWTGQSDLIVGSPVANRRLRETEGLIGFFANTLPLRAAVSEHASFSDVVREIRDTVTRAFDNQDIPFERIVEAVDLPRDRSRNPLFQVLFNYESAWTSTGASLAQDIIKPYDVQKTTSKFDISFYIGAIRGGMEGVLEYSSDLFSPDTARRMANTFVTLIDAASVAPDLPLRSLPLLGVAERRTILEDWNRTAARHEFASVLHHQVEVQAQAAPHAPAVRFGAVELSRRELNVRANRIAHYLRDRGVRPEAVVGVAAERSEHFLPMLLGVMKAGAAYLPLDPGHPAERLRIMAAEAGVEIVLADPTLVDMMRSIVPQVAAAAELAVDECLDTTDPAIPVRPENLAYVLYTSGSTGVPKASMITHAAICNRLAWMQERYRLQPGERVLQKTPFSFDVSLWELFWPLTAGGCVVLAAPGGQRDLDYIRSVIRGEGITTLHFVPSMFTPFLEEVRPEDAGSLRRVVCSGEALPRAAVELARRKLPGVELHNLYGPTEAAVDVTAWDCRDDAGQADPAIGRPIANVQAYILDEQMAPVPPGVRGDLYIGGIALARGYRSRPGLTAERFVPSPFGTGERLYHTGDQAKFGADGVIHFLGRRDTQVKLRGYRIELSEIEAAILAYPQVSQAAVIVRKDGGENGALAAYLVLRKEMPAPGTSVIAGVGAILAERLPSYMQPGSFTLVDALPMTSSGKLHAAALPVPAAPAPREYVAPRTPTETLLAAIWQQVIRIERVGVLDNFFEIGGDSLRSVRIAALAREQGRPFSVQKIFKHQTVAELAQAIDQEAGEPVAAADATVFAPRMFAGVDVSLVDLPEEALERILAKQPDAVAIMPVAPSPWDLIAQWKATGRKEINLVQTIGHTPNLQVELLRHVLDLMVAANPVLRTSYHWDGLAEPVQVVHRAGHVSISYADWRGLTEEEQRARARLALAEDGTRGAEPHLPTPWRIFFGQIGENDYITIQTFNYISLDGWSMLTIGREMQAIYRSFLSGTPATPAVRPPYAAYLAWVKQHDWAAAEAFWKAELKDFVPLGLTDVFPKQVRDRSAGYASKGMELPSKLTQDIRDGVRAMQVTEGLFYLTAWAVLMCHFTKRLTNVLGVVIAGRSPDVPDIQNMIGYTMNYQPLRLDFRREHRIGDLFQVIKNKSITLMEYETVSLQQIRRWCGYADDAHMFDSLFYFQNIGGYFMDGHSQVISQRRPLAYSRTAYALRFDIFPTVAEIGNQVFAGYERADLTTKEVAGIMTTFAEVVASMNRDPNQTLGSILDHLEGGSQDASVPVTFENSGEMLW